MPHARHPKPIPSRPAAPATFPDTVAEIAEGAANAAQLNDNIHASLRIQNLFTQCFLLNSPGGPIKPWIIGLGAFVAWFCEYSAEHGHTTGTPEQMADLMCDIIRHAAANAEAHK